MTTVLTAGHLFRRIVTIRSLALACVGGFLAGWILRGIPVPNLIPNLYGALVSTMAACLALPLIAGILARDRRAGLEALVALRPVSSVSWAMGRLMGSLSGGVVLLFAVGTITFLVAGPTPLDVVSMGRRMDEGGGVESTWRFPLPAGTTGSFDLHLSPILGRGPTGVLYLEVHRGSSEAKKLEREVVAQRRVTVSIPDFSDVKGDLFVGIRPGKNVVLSETAPELVIGRVPLSQGGISLPRSRLVVLGLGLLAVLAGAAAFRFETACLAGLLALTVTIPDDMTAWCFAAVSLLLVSMIGIALCRRQAMP